MKKLIFKSICYTLLILVALEGYVRVFHLTKDYPSRYVDADGVEKWRPNQSGFSVTGNRRQNFSEYHINNSGFNSYREFKPSREGIELALVGDSFIEGFHQNYYNSIGYKIEQKLPNVDVYEFGYAGYDFADQMHLIHAYKAQFDLIDQVFIGIKFENDLNRSEYHVLEERMKLETPLYKNLRKIKILTYAQNIGLLDPIRETIVGLLALAKPKSTPIVALTPKEQAALEAKKRQTYLANFKALVERYAFDKNRFVLVLDKSKTPRLFLNYLEQQHYKYMDVSKRLKASSRPTTLIYDMHWNNHGRNIVASCIVDYYNINFIKK
jgi:hypothetical protein